MSNYYVFRINYDDRFKLIRRELVNHHLLRQGWGTYGMAIDSSYDTFKAGWQSEWEKDLPDETMRARYNNLSIMLEIEPGDYIIVPKVSVDEDYVCRSFVIAKCKKKYRFDVLAEAEDFGHIIEVEDIFSCSYDKNLHAQNIKSKFIAYQFPLNRVRSESFKESVDELVRLHAEQPDEFEKDSTDLISMIGRATASARNQYLEQIKSALQKIDNHKFEDMIGELFIKNGYTLTDNNWYDGEGGDVDLVFECFNRNTLMYNIYEICDVKMPHIYVQAKKKTGKDAGDIVGVDQLVKMEERISEKNAILMVINLTDEFSDEAKEKADENGIILINGLTFASLLVRYGIEVDIR